MRDNLFLLTLHFGFIFQGFNLFPALTVRENVEIALDPATGKVFWSYPWEVRFGLTVATPRLAGDLLLFSSFYTSSKCFKLDATKPAATLQWEGKSFSEKNTDTLHSLISTPFIENGHIYGVCSYGQLRFGNNYQAQSSGYAWLPSSTGDAKSGDVWINVDNSTGLSAGSFNLSTLYHETLHALGLKHPGNYNAGETSDASVKTNSLGVVEDNLQYTIMSYRDAANGLDHRVGFGLARGLPVPHREGVIGVDAGAAAVAVAAAIERT